MVKSSKIIIISEHYAPENTIGAVRMSKITKYLNLDFEYEILVISKECNSEIKDEILDNDVKNKAKVIRVPKSKLAEGIQRFLVKKQFSSTESPEKKISSLILKVKYKLLNLVGVILKFLIEPILFKKDVMKYIRKINVGDYDAVISTYGPLSGHLIARQIKTLNPRIKWIADFRDPVYNIFTPLGFKNYAKNYPRRVTKKADVVVAVSAGYLDALLLDESKNQIVITNGYDKEDLNDVNITEAVKDKLIISYTGGLYAGKRDLSVLFRCISELNNEGKISKDNIRVHYAGSSVNELLKQAQGYEMESIVFGNGNITRLRALELQMNSDILLLATWNTIGGQGNIPGKFFEYMMMNKPIIGITKGEIPESEVKGIITSARLGFCYEEANSINDYGGLKDYILDLYEKKMDGGGCIPFYPNKDIVESYSYKNKAADFKRLL